MAEREEDASLGPALGDEEAVRRILAGETALFEVLMRRYNQRLFRVARAILRDEGEAEDVMQQAYVNAYTHLHQFEQRARFSTWLTRIAVHEALARRRKRARFEEVDAMADRDGDGKDAEERFTAKGLSPEDEVIRGEMRKALESAIDAIPEIYRSVFLFREVEAMSTAEAALCLGISEDTVKTRLHRARSLLRQEMFERAGLTAGALFPLHLSRCDTVVAGVFAALGLPPPASPQCNCPGGYCVPENQRN